MHFTTNTARVAASFCLCLHLVLFVGFAFFVGPFKYDPESMLVRGEPATFQPGLEAAFPLLVADFYAAMVSALAYAVVCASPGAIRASTLACIVYHVGAIGGFVFCNFSQAVNKEAVFGSTSERIAAHTILGLPAVIAFLFAEQGEPRKKLD